MTSVKSPAEDWFGYWDIRIRNPNLCKKIRTPDWSSHAATKMAKQWIIAASRDFQKDPHLIEDASLNNLRFIRGETGKLNNEEAHARQGQLKNNKWVTQSILIPKTIIYNGTTLDIPDEIAHEIACYIANRLDSGDNVEPSPYCKDTSI